MLAHGICHRRVLRLRRLCWCLQLRVAHVSGAASSVYASTDLASPIFATTATTAVAVAAAAVAAVAAAVPAAAGELLHPVWSRLEHLPRRAANARLRPVDEAGLQLLGLLRALLVQASPTRCNLPVILP